MNCRGGRSSGTGRELRHRHRDLVIAVRLPIRHDLDAANGSTADLVILLVIGLVGYVMRVYDFPVAPVLVGMIPGPLAERQLRRALAISQGDPTVLLTRPIAATLLAITVLVLVAPALVRRWRRGAA